jgi:hypothetical protein
MPCFGSDTPDFDGPCGTTSEILQKLHSMVPTVAHRLFGHPQDVYDRLIKGTQYREGVDVPWHFKIATVYRRICPNDTVIITSEKMPNTSDKLFEKIRKLHKDGHLRGGVLPQQYTSR